MANEITFAALGSDLALAAIFAGALRPKLYDPTDLRATMVRRDFMTGAGSAVTKVGQYTPGQTFTAATSEVDGSNVVNSSLGADSFNHTVARRALKFTTSDLMRMVAPNGSVDLELLAGLVNEAAGLTVTDMLCALFPGLSGTVGDGTAQMSTDLLFDAQYALNTNRVQPPYTAVLLPHCFNQLQKDLRGESGPLQWQGATAEMIGAKGPGFKGTIGGLLNIWDSDSVNLDGGSSYGENGFFGDGAFEYQEAPPPSDLPTSVSVLTGAGDPVRVLLSYDEDNAHTKMMGDYYPSVVEAEDARGVRIRALAA